MDQSVKIAAAGCVLLCGVAAAMMFRHEPPATRAAGNELPLRNQAGTAFDRPLLSGPYEPPVALVKRSLPASRQASRNVTILTPMDPGAPPPPLGEDYPAPGDSQSSRWGTAIRPAFPNASAENASQRLHRIVDGDTLQSLAARYLGSEDRAMEIFEANRDLLSSPKVLPIGKVLKIPPRESAAQPSAARSSVGDVLPDDSEAEDPLVSISD